MKAKMNSFLAKAMRSRLTAMLAGAVVMAAIGTFAWASIPDGSGVIHGCYDTRTGALRVIDTDGGATCFEGEQSLDWNQRGPSEPLLAARVAEDGRVLLGSGIVAVGHVATGEYRVHFGVDIASCYMSLVANGHPGEVSGEPDTQTRDHTVVDVETFDSKGHPADRSFYLIVTCPTS